MKDTPECLLRGTVCYGEVVRWIAHEIEDEREDERKRPGGGAVQVMVVEGRVAEGEKVACNPPFITS